MDRYKARVSAVFAIRVNPWSRPVPTSQALIRRAFDIAQETGDRTFAAYCCGCLISILLASGNPLDEVQGETERALDFAQNAKFGLVVDFLTGELRLIRALRGLTPDIRSLNDTDFDEHRFEQHLEANPSLAWACGGYWVRKLQLRFLAGEHDAALSAAAKAATLMWTAASFLESAEYHFYSALAHAARDDAPRPEERPERMRTITAHCKQLEMWAKSCAENFEDRAALVRAEIARLAGREMEAMGLYEQAIRAAHDSGFAHSEAIAHEVAARFYAARGFETIARSYLQNAYSCYRRWGADGKLRQLERLHPHLGQLPAPLPHGKTVGTPLEHLDLAVVMKTSRAVSEASGLERLLRTLMVVILEHAGAERGLLILQRGKELRIEAEATTRHDTVDVRLRQSRVTPSELPESVLQHAVQTRETVLLDDAQAANQFSDDDYFARRRCRSVFCIPVLKQAEFIGALYLENNLTPYAFTPARTPLLVLLATQAALSLESASLEEKDALLKEVHHRVKNNMQLISSLLSLQAARIGDPAVTELLADSRNRIRSMALVHENLYQAGDFSKIAMANHIQNLCAHLCNAHGPVSQRTEFAIQISDLYLNINQAITCSLLVNELVSNALKHAFPDQRPGHVRVELRPLGGHRLVLAVSDDGVGLPLDLDLARVDTLGLQLVQDLTNQLHGTVEMSRRPGTTFTVTFEAADSGGLEA